MFLTRQTAVNFGVAVVFPLLVYYGVSTFSHPPKWDQFHEAVTYNSHPTAAERAARQEKAKAENAAFTEANRVFSLRLLWVAAPLGYAAILLGASRAAAGFGPGLMFGGIVSVTLGYCYHWEYVEDWLRFVSLLVAMAVLLLVGYWQFNPRSRTTR